MPMHKIVRFSLAKTVTNASFFVPCSGTFVPDDSQDGQAPNACVPCTHYARSLKGVEYVIDATKRKPG